jgi:hypothetical protein
VRLEREAVVLSRLTLCPTQAMPSNLFLNIIIGMSLFAVIGKGMGMY